MKDNYSNDVINNNGFSIHTVIKELVVTHYLHIIPMMWWCVFFNVENNVVKEKVVNNIPVSLSIIPRSRGKPND